MLIRLAKGNRKLAKGTKQTPIPVFSNILPVVSGRFENVSRSYAARLLWSDRLCARCHCVEQQLWLTLTLLSVTAASSSESEVLIRVFECVLIDKNSLWVNHKNCDSWLICLLAVSHLSAGIEMLRFKDFSPIAKALQQALSQTSTMWVIQANQQPQSI